MVFKFYNKIDIFIISENNCKKYFLKIYLYLQCFTFKNNIIFFIRPAILQYNIINNLKKIHTF